LATPREIDQRLQEGINAAKAGQFEKARFLLLDVVEQNQTNEVAWYWLYNIFHNIEDKRVCLENLIIINPNNRWAKEELLKYLDSKAVAALDRVAAKVQAKTPRRSPTKKSRPIVLYLVSAFWLGISFIFLSSGIIWLLQILTFNSADQNPAYSFILNFLIAIAFSGIGILGLSVAIGLYLRSILGFYGSILLSLGLLLIGPTVSLISVPPNYVTMLCTGGISGRIMLLTLASQAGFESFSQNDNAPV